MSLVLSKPAFCICENKDTDQLGGNREADQRLCFRYTDSTIPLQSNLYYKSATFGSGLNWLIYTGVCLIKVESEMSW